MTEKDINSINRFLDKKIFDTKVRIWDVEESDLFELSYKFKILGTKKMISVGEYYDFLKLDVEIVGSNDVTKQLFAIFLRHEYPERVAGDFDKRLDRFIKNSYLIKVDLDKSISGLLKYFLGEEPRIVIENVSASDSFIQDIIDIQNTV